MNLNRAERDYYVVSITTDPALAGTWQASFDGGTTWVNGASTADGWTWLVAGPDFDAAAVGMDANDTDATITAAVTPLGRIAEDPVLDIERLPYIKLV